MNHLARAWSLFKRPWLAFVLVQLAIVLAWVVLEVAVVAAHSSRMPSPLYRILWLCLHVAFFWVFCGLMAGIHMMALEAADGGTPTFATALSRFDRAAAYLLTSLLYWAVVLIGLCLLIVPGIVVATRWALFRFVLVDRSRSVRSTLQRAAELSSSQRWPLFRALAVSLLLNLAGAAFLGVGLLVTFPVTILFRASLFRYLQEQSRTSVA